MNSSAPSRAQTSLWLLAAPQDEAALAEIISALSQRHGTTAFHPHMTLLGDIPLPPQRLEDATSVIAAAAQPFSVPIISIDISEAFYRSFYARFDAAAPLPALRHAALGATAMADSPFLAHVSLLYGPVPAPEKHASQQRLHQAWAGRQIRFDRLALTNSANDVPIADWRMLKIVPLGGSPTT